MIKFFRKIRQKMLTENKFSKYLIYAIGEITLVVIGILIALQVNNFNEQRKSNELLKSYENNIISELEKDLINFNELDSLNRVRKSTIEDYIDYYNSEKININILKAKADSTQMRIAIFNTNSYTVQDLMTTGNLKLFSAHKKNAILKYKNSQDNYILIQLKTIDLITTKFEDYEKEIDVLFTNGYANKEHIEVKGWQYDLNSTQFRKRNNYLTTFLELYKYQITAMKKLRKETIELRNLLEKK